MSDVIGLQREVAETIIIEIRGELTSLPRAHLANDLSVNPEAYDAYLKGRFNANRLNHAAALRAVEFLQEAIRLSPDSAPAYAALADANFMLAVPLGDYADRAEVRQYFSQSEAAARKALSLDDSLAEAHARLGEVILFRDWNWGPAQTEVLRALELNPHCLWCLYARAIQLTAMGRHEESRQFMRRALEVDPVNPLTGALGAELLLYAHRYDEAETEVRRALALDPTYERAHVMLAWVYEFRGQGEQAAYEYARSGRLSSEEVASLTGAFHTNGMHGFYTWWLGIFQKLAAQHHPVIPFHYAHAYAGMNDRERTLHYLEEAFQQHDHDVLFCKVFPLFESLRSDPRFQELVGRMNYPQ